MSGTILHNRLEYVYLIRHIRSGMFYAGSKSAKREYCHPDAFWNKEHKHGYFTSSKVVKALIVSEGVESFEVLEIIQRPMNDARSYESDFLKSFDAANNEKWINKSNGDGKFHSQNVETRRKISEALTGKPSGAKGRKCSDESRKRMSISARARIGPNHRKGKTASDETKARMSLAAKGRTSPTKGKIKGPTTDAIKAKISAALTGIKRSDETRKKNAIAATGRPSPLRGVTPSDDTRLKISLSKLGKKREVTECPHCGKVGGNMYRWHFNKCKQFIGPLT